MPMTHGFSGKTLDSHVGSSQLLVSHFATCLLRDYIPHKSGGPSGTRASVEKGLASRFGKYIQRQVVGKKEPWARAISVHL